MSESPTQFLQKHYDLQKSPEVQRTAQRARKRGEIVSPQDPEALINAYVHRLSSLLHPLEVGGHQDFDRKARNIEMLKASLCNKVISKPETIPASYDAIAVIADQQHLLDTWIDYLTSDDARFRDELKYWVFRSVLKMGKYDKTTQSFAVRQPGKTISPFPTLNQEALGFVIDAVEKKMAAAEPLRYRGENIQFRDDVSPEDRQQFFQLLSQPKESFSKLYAWAIDHIKLTPRELLKIIDGEWRNYPQGSSPAKLVNDIKDYGTGWCIRGEGYATRYLKDNHLSVYFSNDTHGNAVIPRVVIVESPDRHVKEVRGIEDQENLDSWILPKVQEKLEGQYANETDFLKKLSDVRQLTTIERNVQAGKSLTKDDLRFLYEMDHTIEGFGYQDDPRIKALRESRNPKDDALIVLAPPGRNKLAPDEIAWREEEIAPYTQTYIGPLFPDMFEKLHGIEHIYTSFPEEPLDLFSQRIGGKTVPELEDMLNHVHAQRSNIASFMLHSQPFQESLVKKPTDIPLVRLSLKAMGLTGFPTTTQVFKRASELGLQLVPPETAVYLRCADREQKNNMWYFMGMEPIGDAGGSPEVFILGRFDDELWLDSYWADPVNHWSPRDQFVFSRRK